MDYRFTVEIRVNDEKVLAEDIYDLEDVYNGIFWCFQRKQDSEAAK